MSKSSTTDESGPLLGPADIRELAAALGVRPTKQLGQNFVIDANTVRRIVRTAEVRPDDVVVEVGPGLGSLTLALLEAADRVDRRRDRRRAGRRAARHRRGPDAGRARTASRWCTPTRCRSPSCPARRRPRWSPTCRTTWPSRCCCTCSRPSPPSSAPWSWCRPRSPTGSPPAPGNKVYGVPSVKANWYAEVRRAGVDRPQRLLARAQRRLRPGLPGAAREPPRPPRPAREVFAVVDAAFAQRRKTLRAALAGWAGSAAGRRGRADRGRGLAAGPRRGPDRRGVRRASPSTSRSAHPHGARRMSRAPAPPSPSGCPPRSTSSSRWAAPRPDGFHDLANVFLAVGLYDEVTATPADGLRITVDGPGRRPGPAGPHEPRGPRGASRSPPGTASSPTSTSTSPRTSRSPAAWPAAAPTRAGALLACDALWGTGASRERTARHLRRAGQRRAVQPGRRRRARARAAASC